MARGGRRELMADADVRSPAGADRRPPTQVECRSGDTMPASIAEGRHDLDCLFSGIFFKSLHQNESYYFVVLNKICL